jgi:sugar-specific transcriptional regulator TrmB
MSLIKKIQEIGLSEKESRIYIGLMELGEATAQQLAMKTGLNRATAYIILEELMQRRLISKINKQKKTYFTIEHPSQILELLHKEKDQIEIRINLAKKLMPELEMLETITGERAKVKFFEGKDGIKMIQKEIIRSNPKIIDQIFDINRAVEEFPVSENDHRQISRKREIGGRSLVIYDPKKPIPYLPPFSAKQTRYMPQNKILFHAEIVLYNDKAVLMGARQKLMAIMVQNKEIVDGLRFLFELAWQGSEKYATKIPDKKSSKH